MYCVKEPITEHEQIREILGEEFASQTAKVIDHIDDHCRLWIERSPFLIVASSDAKGNTDASPKGDPAGFVKVLDAKTLAIPDRIGNHRGDTFFNLLENPSIGLIFIVPGRKEVIRINGQATIARDIELREMMKVNGHQPDLAIIVRVQEAFFHCGKSMIRSGMWQPDKWPSVDGLPSYAQALKDHGALPDHIEDLENRMSHNETDRLY
ncbi:pyridoxamine 5'-phosphate oxidase family protein [Parasedimentitalea marina]|uniref:Pyridoxamine 5'-phosphate oxidase family protein n=1 Tax=Parasedimentitalea marina TaxID=2483033 RepID=A0A3T0N714_9RHOB|nr:MSMEG_1061 family FMN-dependent PPOX-type flavoprotein [Parasedimentitalea marina]AZV79820.1 pyridoxamine 5'-phosphate oxidase family protein [Parasedimentitalea marina]